MLKRLSSLVLAVLLMLCACGALAEGGDLRHKITGDVSQFEVSEEAGLSSAQLNPETGNVEMGTDLYLFVDPDSASYITFLVVDEQGNPIKGAAIYLSYGGFTDFYGLTNEEGKLSVYLFRNTRYGYYVEKEGYLPESGSFVATEATRVIKVVLRKLYNLDIFVRNNGVPVPGLDITVQGETLTTDDDGHVRYRLPNGLYDATIELPGGRHKAVRIRVQGDTVYVIDFANDELFIVFDRDYDPEDYDLRMFVFEDEEIVRLLGLQDEDDEEVVRAAIEAWRADNHNVLSIIAEPDKIQYDDRADDIVLREDGEPQYTQRSLILSGWQLLGVEERSMQTILFENERMGMRYDIADLYSPDMAKLFHFIYHKHAVEATKDSDEPVVDLYPELELTDELDVNEFDFSLIRDVWRWFDEPELKEQMRLQLVEATGDELAEVPELTESMFGNARMEARVTPLLADELLRAMLGEEPYMAESALDEVLLISRELREIWLRDYLADGNLTRTEYEELKDILTEGAAYRVQLFMMMDGVEVNVTGLTDSMQVRMNATEDILTEAEEYVREQLELRKAMLESGEITPEEAENMPDAEELKAQYIGELYDDSHMLLFIRNEGLQAGERGYEPGAAVLDETAIPTDGLPEDEEARAALIAMLDGRVMDVYDVDVREEEFAWSDVTGWQHIPYLTVLPDVPLELAERWEIRHDGAGEGAASGAYLIYELPEEEPLPDAE